MSCSIFFLKKLLTYASIHDIMNELSRKTSNTDNNSFWKKEAKENKKSCWQTVGTMI